MTSDKFEDQLDAIRVKIYEKTKHMNNAEKAEYFNTSARKFIERSGYILTKEGKVVPKPAKKMAKKDSPNKRRSKTASGKKKIATPDAAR